MKWDMDDTDFRLGSHRVQKKSQPSTRHSHSQGYYYTCDGAANTDSAKKTQSGGGVKADSTDCEDAIR